MAAGDFTKNTMDKWLPEVWSPVATVTYRANTVFDPLLDHRWEPELGVGRGDLIQIPGFTQNQRSDTNTRSSFGTGATLTFTVITEGQTTLNVDQMAYHAWRMPVEMSLQTLKPYEQLLLEGVPQSLALQYDYYWASDATDGIDAFSDIGADNVDITDDVILEGETNLNNVNAPLSDRYLVISPASRGSLMQIEVLRNQLYGASVGNLSGAKGAGYLGKIYTLDVYMSNNLETVTSGKRNAIFHKEAIAVARQQDVKIEKGLNIADGLFNEYVGYLVYGGVVVKSTFGRSVLGK